MTIPMFDVCIREKPERWESVTKEIHDLNDLIWFEELKGWKTLRAPVTLNGLTKECDIYLIAKDHGWVQWKDFFPDPTPQEMSQDQKSQE